MPPKEHRKKAEAAGIQAVSVAVVTVSDTRTEATDQSGGLIKDLLAEAGHQVVAYHLVKDEPADIEKLLDELTADSHPCQVIIFNGGTGISKRDRTFDVINSRLEKVMPGFGEIFRLLSYQEIGAAAMFSRAVAGTCRERVIFSTPGSSGAVRLAMEKLIIPELGHLVWEQMR